MEGLITRKGVRCQAVHDGWNVTIWASDTHAPPEGCKAPYGRRAGTGQREITMTRRTVYSALSEERAADAVCDSLGQEFGLDVDLEVLALNAEKNKRRAASRAKRECRRKIKHAGYNQLLTLTYRENMTDFDRMRRDLAAFVRKMRALIPGFRTVYGFETQDRGAWHAHMAVDRLPMLLQHKGVKVKSFDVARAVWRSIVGADNGNVDVDGHRRRGRQHADQRKSSLARMAGYVSKYLTKDHGEGLFGRNMWGSTQGQAAPPAIRLELPECSMADAISCAFEVPAGHRVALHRLVGKDKDRWVLYTEPDS